jgi:type I restriction enzyme S subunit
MSHAHVRYATYKDSGIEWLGDVPETWTLNRHKDNFSFVSDKCVTSSLTKVGLENIEGKTGRFISTDSEFDGDGVEFKKYDILFGKLRPYLAKVYLAEFEGNAVGDIFVYRPKKSITSKFAQYLMLSDRYIDVINSSTTGAKMPRVSSNFIANLHISTPPIAEQTVIAAYLDTKTAQINRKIDLLSQKAAQYGKLKQSLIYETVNGGLDKAVPMKDSGVEWIGEVPAHWRVHRIADIAVQNKVKNRDLIEKNLLSLSYGRIICKDFNTSFGLLPESFETYQVVTAGTVILRLTDLQNDQRSLRVGLAREQGIITSAYLGLCFQRSINSVFAHYLLHVYDLCKVFYWFGGGLRSTMRFDDIKVIPFILPPIEEQQAIAEYLDEKTAHIDHIVATINTQIDNLKELRKTLINDAVTGKIKVA